MHPGEPVVIVGYGARTAIGLTAPASAAAARAGIAGFGEHPFMVDTAGNRMIVARAAYLSIDLTGQQRLAALAGPALAEAAAPLRSTGYREPVPVFIGLSADRPGRSSHLPRIVDRLRDEMTDCGLRVGHVRVLEAGHAAGTMAVQAAWETIRSGAVEFALAGGVDSYLEPETLEWLEANDQIHSAGPHNNPYGFIPGEAGGFVLLAAAAAANDRGLDITLEVPVVAFARETNLIKTDGICKGDGMTTLFRLLAGDPPVTRADHLVCDMNGEPYRADEFGFAVIRAGELFVDPLSFSTPADCWGDVGAASGPLFLVLADAAVRKGYSPGPTVVGFTSSESGERCGFIVRGDIQEGPH